MNRFLQRISFALLLSLPLLLPHQANAQGISLPASGTYTQTFDNIAGGLPAGWTVRTGATNNFPQSLGTEVSFTTAPAAWDDTADGFKNVASADGLSPTDTSAEQAGSSDRALGIRQSAASGDPGAAFTLQLNNTLGVPNLNLKFKIQSLNALATRTTTWRVEYGLGTVPPIYFPLGTSFTTSGTAFSNREIAINLGSNLNSNSGPVRLRIISDTPTSGSGSRPITAIDDVVLTYSTTPDIRVSTLNTLTYGLGNGPATESFSLSAYYLGGAPNKLTVRPNDPSVFSVSSDGVNFGPTAVIPFATGDPFSSTIKVQLAAGLPVGIYRTFLSVVGEGINYSISVNALITQTANQPVVIINPTSLTGTRGITNYVGFKEKFEFISLLGVNLTGTPPSSFTITSSNPSAFQVYGNDNLRSGRAVVSYSGVNSSSRTIQFLLIEGLGVGQYTGSLLIEGRGIVPITVPLSGTVEAGATPPVITANPTSLPIFSTTQGIPSVPQTFTLTARSSNSMSGQINFSSPAGFEVSFPPYTMYNQSPALGPGPDYDIEMRVRMTGTEVGTFGGPITIVNTTSGSAITVSVSGRVNVANTQPLSVTAVSYTCQTGALLFGRLGGDPNRAVDYTAVGVKSYSTDPNGIIDSAKRNDPNSGTSVMLRARYVGDASSEVSFDFDFGAYCSGTTPPPVVVPPTPTPGTFAITGVTMVSCQAVTAGERNLIFTPQYTGLSGSPVSFSVVNELTPTTNAGPYTLQVYTDNPTITLKAVQTGTVNEANFTYNWLAACNANGRAGATESGTALRVRVLGNPVEGKTAEVEISGVAGQAVDMELTDLQGRSLYRHHIRQAGVVERVIVPVGDTKSLLLLRVNTAVERREIKLLKL